MNQYKPNPALGRPTTSAGDDPMMDFRARLVQQQTEAADRRRIDLAEQCSRLKTAEERIRIWERIHEVTLPRDSEHRLVQIIEQAGGQGHLVMLDGRKYAFHRLANFLYLGNTH